jgi:TRAP-type C4-dicarboxylate transport system substrate-binding protein
MTRFSSSVYRTTFSFFVNKDKWAEISPEDQAAIRAISQDKIGNAAAELWEKADDVYDTFEANGIKVVDADPALEAALVERAAIVIDAWKGKSKAAGIDADAALAFYLERAADLAK